VKCCDFLFLGKGGGGFRVSLQDRKGVLLATVKYETSVFCFAGLFSCLTVQLAHVALRLTFIQAVCPGVETLCELQTSFLLFGYGASSLTRGGSVVYPLGVPLTLCSSRRDGVKRYEHDIQCLCQPRPGAADSALPYSVVAVTTAQSLEQSPA
jgi:hypothetical protein